MVLVTHQQDGVPSRRSIHVMLFSYVICYLDPTAPHRTPPDHIEGLFGLYLPIIDRAMIGRGEFYISPSWVRHRMTTDVWGAMSDQQRQRACADCFRLQSAPSTSTSADGLTVTYQRQAGKKINQCKRRCAEQSMSEKKTG